MCIDLDRDSRFGRWLVAGLFIVAQAISAGPKANAQDVQLADTTLAVVPQDVAFFSTSLNSKQAFEEFFEGELVTRLRTVPFVKNLEAELLSQWEDPQSPQVSQAKEVLTKNPTVKDLLNLFSDMLSKECFVYGGNDWNDTIGRLVAIQNDVTYAAQSGDPEEYFQNGLVDSLAELTFPTTVLGFRLEDDEAAKLQLDVLESLLRYGVGNIPQAKPFIQRLKRNDLDNGQTLTLALDASLIPLDEVDEGVRPLVQQIVTKFEGRQFSVGLGVKDNLVLIAFGESPEIVNEVGEASAKLIDHTRLSTLKENLPQKLRSVAFSSGEWQKSQFEAQMKGYFQRIAAQVSGPMSSELAEDNPQVAAEWVEMLNADAAELDEQLEKMYPEFGDTLAWSYALDRQLEGVVYSWTENTVTENASPLSILKHADPDAFMVAAYDLQVTAGLGGLVEYALKAAPKHVKQFIELAERDEEEKARALLALDEGWPLLIEAYEALRDKVIPSFGDYQNAISFSGGWKLDGLPDLPVPPQPLALPEIGGATSLSDAELFIEGCSDIYEVFDKVTELVRKVDPSSVPPSYTVPRPDEELLSNGTRYYYGLISDQVPIPGFSPQLVVTEDAIIYGYSQRQVDAMLEPGEFDEHASWINDESAVSSEFFLSFPQLLAAARPWVLYGLSVDGRPLSDPVAPGNGPIPTGDDILQIYDCFQASGSVHANTTVTDDGVSITRWNWSEK